MKNQLLKKLLIFISIAGVAITSCKKDNTEEPEIAKAPKLARIAFWNPATNVESNNVELVYDANGTATSIIYSGTTFTATYNGANKLSTLSGTFKQGLVVTYTLEYNAIGQLVKVVYTDGGTNANTKTISYNTAGKIIKIGIVYANTAITPYNADYTWNGDNLASASSGTYTSTYTTYDDKFNPFSLAEGISIVFYGVPASKNNCTEIKTVNAGNINTQKRVYEYNTAGYATSMKLTDGSNEGQKYYYVQ